MLISVENWWPKPPAHRPVDPMPTIVYFSRTTTSVIPRLARWCAMLRPTTPAPMITTSAVFFICEQSREAALELSHDQVHCRCDGGQAGAVAASAGLRRRIFE